MPRLSELTLVAAAAVGAIAVFGNAAQAAIYQDAQPRQPLVDKGAAMSAANGGASVTMKIFSSAYDPSVNNGLLVNGALVVSGTLGPAGPGGVRSIFGGSHTLMYGGATPDTITRIEVYSGTNLLSDPGQMRLVTRNSVHLAPGANGTLQSLDLFGATLTEDFAGIANISISGAAPGTLLTHSGNGYSGNLSTVNSGAPAVRDFQLLGWDGIGDGSISPLVSDTYLNATRFSSVDVPPNNAKAINGDSNGPTILSESILFDNAGRITALSLAGVVVGQTGNGNSSGSNLYVDFGNPTAAAFVQSFVPEPGAAFLLATVVPAVLLRRRRAA
ncbi:MAG TPA: hypothetical protein VF624_00130 [Tepidisphaeraceae bacterium]|jgi:hypothetical protein